MKIPNLKTYKDGRKPVKELYSSFLELERGGWILDVLGFSNCVRLGKKISLPIIALRTPKKGKSIWIISGVHGEEPAGPNAISEPEAIEYLKKMGKKVPIVLLPLCNPLGYLRNWRCINRSNCNRNYYMHSVDDADHYLPSFRNKNLLRKEKSSCAESAILTRYIVEKLKKYPPIMSLNFHEDNFVNKGYVYSQGRLGKKDPIAKKIVKILLDSGVQIETKGKTRFDEKIINGIIGNEKLDGSIDELLATNRIILNGKPFYKPAAKTSIVIETPIKTMKLKEREKAQMNVLLSLEKFIKNGNR